MRTSNHIMLDLETLSTLPNARIIAIGAVTFSEAGITDKFYQAVQTPTLDFASFFDDFTDKEGFHISKDTVDWWQKQSLEAQAVFTDPNAIPTDKALLSFFQWASKTTEDDVRVWGNGAAFDNVIMASAYRLKKMAQPWKFWNDRCYRTVKAQNPTVHMKRLGEHHNALDDAESQAQHLLEMEVRLA